MPTTLTPTQLQNLAIAIAAAPLPIETKERLADIIEVATPEELVAIAEAFHAADVDTDALDAQMAELDAHTRSLHHDMQAALDAESARLVAEYAAGELPSA